MLAPLPSVEAFRRDAVSDGVELDDGVAASWLESATRLERAAMTRGAERDRLLVGFLSQQDVVTFPASEVSTPAVISAATEVANEMEDQAFFRLAHSLLSTLLLIVPVSEHLAGGRIIAQLARLARHLGDIGSAIRYYDQVDQMGSDYALPELSGRALVGHGILAQFRGDFPTARRNFNAAIELEGAAGESVAIAHQQLAVAAAAARDFDSATTHAWKAYQGASSQTQEIEALVNLAQLLLEAGYPRAALRGFAAALARNPISRFELPALGGAACAAAASLPLKPARALIHNFAERVDMLVTSLRSGASMPYQSAQALVEVSEALAVVGDEQRSLGTAERAEMLASANGFHQLTYRLENPVHVAQPAQLAPATSEIIAAVDELEGAELVGVAG